MTDLMLDPNDTGEVARIPGETRRDIGATTISLAPHLIAPAALRHREPAETVVLNPLTDEPYRITVEWDNLQGPAAPRPPAPLPTPAAPPKPSVALRPATPVRRLPRRGEHRARSAVLADRLLGAGLAYVALAVVTLIALAVAR